MSMLVSTTNDDFIALVALYETGKLELIYNWAKIGIFPAKCDEIYFFMNSSNQIEMLCKKKLKLSSLFDA